MDFIQKFFVFFKKLEIIDLAKQFQLHLLPGILVVHSFQFHFEEDIWVACAEIVEYQLVHAD